MVPGDAPTNAPAAVAPAKAARPAVVKPAPAKPLEYSPGVAELSPAERRAAFMAATTEPKTEATKEPEKETDTEAADSTTEKEGNTEEAAQTERAADTTSDTESEGETQTDEAASEGEDGDLVSGLAKLSKDNPKLKGLLKRTQKVLQQNSERAKELEMLKAELDAAKAKPPVVLPPSAENPLSHLYTEEQVDTEVRAIKADARSRVRWLERHLEDGGVWNEGAAREQPLSAAQVAKALTYYEDLLDGRADDMGKARKSDLSTYLDTVKTLGVPAEDLVKPAVPTRESRFFARIPEMQRDPTFLQFLADAKAGREAREEKAQGVKTVKIKPGETKPKAETERNSTKAAASDGKPAKREAETITTTDLAALRTQAAAGNPEARAALRRAFVQQA